MDHHGEVIAATRLYGTYVAFTCVIMMQGVPDNQIIHIFQPTR